jgi:hypothetical protein
MARTWFFFAFKIRPGAARRLVTFLALAKTIEECSAG